MRLSGKHSISSALLVIYLAVFFPKPALFAQVLPATADIGYLYNPDSPISIRHQLVSSNDKIMIVLEVSAPKAIADSLVYGFAFTPSMDKPLDSFTKLEASNFRIFESEQQQQFAIDVSNVKASFVVFRILQQSTSNNYTYIVELGNPSGLIISTSQLTLPDLKGYVNKEGSAKLSTLYGSQANFGVKFFEDEFAPALPPMADMKRPGPFEKPDTTFTIKSGEQLATNKIGTYTFFREDKGETISYFRVEDTNYPKIATVDQLIEASVYLLTKDENKKLSSSRDPKKAYDSFWLNNTNSADRAGKMISAYFKRVKEANEKFIAFKEGWKTDMGMIYIIFGPPDKAFRTNDGVQWVYKKTYELPSMMFTFYSDTKFFTSEYYVLERSTQFQTVWFRAVELWRKGRKSL